jgi:hypothetical protein
MNRWNVGAALRKPKDINGNPNKPNGVVMAVVRVHRDLIGMDEVDCRKYRAACQVVGVVVNVPEWVAVRDGTSVEGPVVTTRAPTVFLLWDEM